MAGRVKVTLKTDLPFIPVRAHFVGKDGGAVPPVMKILNKGSGLLEGLRPGTWEIECEMARTGDSAEKQALNRPARSCPDPLAERAARQRSCPPLPWPNASTRTGARGC